MSSHRTDREERSCSASMNIGVMAAYPPPLAPSSFMHLELFLICLGTMMPTLPGRNGTSPARVHLEWCRWWASTFEEI